MKMALTGERIKILGEGTYGFVHLEKISTACFPGYRLVAVKSVDAADEELVSSLRDEKKVLQQFIGSPYIVQCYGGFRSVDQDDDQKRLYSLHLEYARGGSLLDLMEDYGGRIPKQDVKLFVRMILKGLVEIHQKGFIHSDLKPDNILVFYSGGCINLKIADFGLVKVLGEEDTTDWEYGFRGTAPYMSPESVIGKVSGALDIWSLGCVVVEMIIGKLAWEYDDMGDLRDKLLRETPNIQENMSNLGKDFLMKCFARNPNERWTAAMLLHHPFLQPYQTLPPPGFPSCTSGSCLSSTNPGGNKTKLLGTGSTNSEDSEGKLLGITDASKTTSEALVPATTYEVITKEKISFQPPEHFSNHDELFSPDEGRLFEDLLRSRKIRIGTRNRMLAVYC